MFTCFRLILAPSVSSRRLAISSPKMEVRTKGCKYFALCSVVIF
nr:MAG TPA: hypothetical protein [Caudoviricetes sp.]